MMTVEKFKETMKLADEIETMETFQNAFHEPCMKNINAYRIGVDVPAILSIESDSELFQLIDNYLERQLSEMKKKFEEM